MLKFGLATVTTWHGEVAALAFDDGYWPLSAAEGVSVKAILGEWAETFPRLQRIAEACRADPDFDQRFIPKGQAKLETPIKYPNKLFAVGANYADHLAEMGMAPKKWDDLPFFMKPPTTAMVGPGKTVILPKTTKQFDWEVELAVVIGTRMKDVDEATARAGIAGYSIGLDLSCRDIMRDKILGFDVIRGKGHDTMGPVGPIMVPAAFINDPGNLRLRLSVNGNLKQDGTTSDMLYGIEEQISTISRYVTLEPGDVLMTGTPAGCGSKTGEFLAVGDKISAEIDQIGCLEVEVI